MAEVRQWDTGSLRGGWSNAVAVTTSDANAILDQNGNAVVTNALYIGVSGDVKVLMESGQTVTFKSAPVGFLNVRVTQVFSTGTAATNIVAVW